MRKTHNIQAFCPHGGHTSAHRCHQFYECLHSKKQRPEKFRAPRAAFLLRHALDAVGEDLHGAVDGKGSHVHRYVVVVGCAPLLVAVILIMFGAGLVGVFHDALGLVGGHAVDLDGALDALVEIGMEEDIEAAIVVFEYRVGAAADYHTAVLPLGYLADN